MYAHPQTTTDREKRTARRRSRRGGFTMLELLVSAILLIALISIVVPLTVRAGRIWQDARNYRLAVNELSNQLEDLTLLSDQDRQQALENWKPSPELLDVLPEAKLTGETIDDSDGKRVKLTLAWQRAVGTQPLSMIAWVHPENQQ